LLTRDEESADICFIKRGSGDFSNGVYRSCFDGKKWRTRNTSSDRLVYRGSDNPLIFSDVFTNNNNEPSFRNLPDVPSSGYKTLSPADFFNF
jgi:hypothetical protein